MSSFAHDGLKFHYHSEGAGLPLVMLHGLGGDRHQPEGLFQGLPGVRLITLDFRAHGETRPLGAEENITIARFAEDVRALLDHLSLPSCVLGGISLGAAVALRFALDWPARLRALILSRPAWLAGPTAFNRRVYHEIAGLIRAHGAAEGQSRFRQSETYERVLAESSDAARSLLGQFDSPRAADAVCRLERLPADAPIDRLEALAAIRLPTLVLANRIDPIHPFAFGETLAGAIAGAAFGELTAKSTDADRHRTDCRWYVGDFLTQHFSSEVPQHA